MLYLESREEDVTVLGDRVLPSKIFLDEVVRMDLEECGYFASNTVSLRIMASLRIYNFIR